MSDKKKNHTIPRGRWYSN